MEDVVRCWTWEKGVGTEDDQILLNEYMFATLLVSLMTLVYNYTPFSLLFYHEVSRSQGIFTYTKEFKVQSRFRKNKNK